MSNPSEAAPSSPFGDNSDDEIVTATAVDPEREERQRQTAELSEMYGPEIGQGPLQTGKQLVRVQHNSLMDTHKGPGSTQQKRERMQEKVDMWREFAIGIEKRMGSNDIADLHEAERALKGVTALFTRKDAQGAKEKLADMQALLDDLKGFPGTKC